MINSSISTRTVLTKSR